MAKKELTKIKLQIVGGQANPAPPIGPALGQHGVNIQSFCVEFNNKTKNRAGEVVPVIITVYEDRSFSFVMKTPPASELLKKAAGVQKGSQKPNTDKIGSVTKKQIREIAQIKMPDLNTDNIDAAMRIIEGTAKQMGLTINE